MQSDPSTPIGSAARASQSPGVATPAAQGDPLRSMLGQPIATGADFVEQIARSAHSLADALDGGAPQLAQMVRRAAGSAETFSHDIRDKSVNELVGVTQDFARSQPALFVGAAATAGFLLARLIKAGVGEVDAGARAPTARTLSGGQAAPERRSAGTYHDA